MQTVTSLNADNPPTPLNEVVYTYDGWGNVVRERQAHTTAEVDNGTGASVQYHYDDGADANGRAAYLRLTDVVYPNDRHVGYNYAAGVDSIMSRLSDIFDDLDSDGDMDAGEAVSSYKYLGLGQIVEEDNGAAKLTYLDSNGDVTGLDRFGRVVDQVWKDYSENVIDEYRYGYDRAGNRWWKQNVGQNASGLDELYSYDALDRLTNTQRGTVTVTNGVPSIESDSYQDWTLDGLGNFSEFDDDGDVQTRDTNAANEIETITGGTVTPAYDAAGNMISGPSADDPGVQVHYKYDAWNRLTAVYEDDQGEAGDPIAAYSYDGRNHRVTKTLADETVTDYYYNTQWQLLEERTLTSDPEPLTSIDQYIWSQRYIDAPVVRFHDGNGDGDVADEGDSTLYYTGDASYNVTALVDPTTGHVVERYVYDAYGKVTVCYGNDGAGTEWSQRTNNQSAYANEIRFAGYFFDAETGNALARNRYYSVTLATWISRDPIGYRGGINLYEYVGDNPLKHTDPTGRKVEHIKCQCTWKRPDGSNGAYWTGTDVDLGTNREANATNMTALQWLKPTMCERR